MDKDIDRLGSQAPHQSKSKRRRGKPRKSSKDDKEENILAIEERLHQMNQPQRSSSKRDRTRSSNMKPKVSAENGRRNTRHRQRTRRRSSRTASDSSHSRSSTQPSSSEGDSIHDPSIDSEHFASDATPGAYRVDTVGQVSPLSSSRHQRISINYNREDPDEVSDIASQSARTRSHISSRSTMMVAAPGGQLEDTTVQAVVAQDYEDEIENARQRGRREALQEVSQQTTQAQVAMTVTAAQDDEDGKTGIQGLAANKRACCYGLLLGLFLIAVGVAATMLLFGVNGDEEVTPLFGNDHNETSSSNAKIVIVYTPPSPQECEAIVNGTLLADQQSLIRKSFDIYMDITLTTSEDDLGSVLLSMLGYIQEKLIPIMAGCGAIGFFDTNLVLADGLRNATNSIVNGQVKKESEQSCNAGLDGECRSYVLVLDLYLKDDEQSSAKLIEVIGNAIDGEVIANLLESLYQIDTPVVAVPWIVPSATILNATIAPDSVIVVPSESPTPDFAHKPAIVKPNAAPALDIPLTLNPTFVASVSPSDAWHATHLPSTRVPYQSPSPFPSRANTQHQIPTAHPSSRLTSPHPLPTADPSTRPRPLPTVAPATTTPTKDPTKGPTKSPSLPPMAIASSAPSHSPISSPSLCPSITTSVVPTVTPTLAPTPVPSETPSVNPSVTPSTTPSLDPSPQPSVTPTTPPTPLPTVAVTPAPTSSSSPASWCCSVNYKDCDIGGSYCNSNQHSCEVNCSSTWIQAETCSSGLERWAECTNDVTGCCPPAVCTSQGPGYKQCL